MTLSTLDDFDDANTLEQVISPAALSVAKKYDRLDSYSQAVVEAVVDLELARVNTLGGQTGSKSAVIYPKRNAIIRMLKQPYDICIRRG